MTNFLCTERLKEEGFWNICKQIESWVCKKIRGEDDK